MVLPKIKSHQISQVRYLLLVPVVITTILLLFFINSSWNFYNDLEEVENRDLEIQRLMGRIVYLDEVLTMSARMASATGNLQWERRYQTYEPQLEEAIAKASELVPSAYAGAEVAKTEAANRQLVEMEQRALTLIENNQQQKAQQLLTSEAYQRQKQKYSQGMETIRDRMQDKIQQSLANKKQEISSTMGGTAIGVFLAIVAWVWVVRLLNQSIEGIRYTGKSLREASDRITQSASEGEDLAQEQSAAVRETATTIQQLSHSSQQTTEKAEGVSEEAKQVLDMTKNGTQLVEETLTNIEQLQQQVETTATGMERLSDRAQQIENISKLSSELANTTNMLALNASVEATRAGKHGKGFQVVAKEIRRLADRSGSSASQISTIVSEIQNEINASTKATEQVANIARQTVDSVKNTTEKFTFVAQSIQRVSTNNQEIVSSAQEQAQAIQQVNEAIAMLNDGIGHLVETTRKNREIVEQLNTTNQKLRTLV
jgi:methyl-accepting chemotaxis protein